MSWWDRPLYLHLLDRELGESVQYVLIPDAAELVLKTLAIGTTAPMYCGLSLLWESPGMAGDSRSLLTEMISGGVVDAVSAHPTLDEFLASRQVLYAHDAARYPMYFARGDRSRDAVPPTRLKIESTTKALASELSAWALSAGSSDALPPELERVVRQRLAETLARRETEAITFSLFDRDLGDLVSNPAVVGFVRREISKSYARHYMEFGNADIPTGVNGLQYFDSLAQEFPLFDVPLLINVLATTVCAEVLRQPWGRFGTFWSGVSAWRNDVVHVAFRSRLRFLLRVLLEVVRRETSKRTPAGIGVAGARLAIQAILKPALGAAIPATSASISDATFPEEALLAINNLITWCRRDRACSEAMAAVAATSPEERCDVLLVVVTEVERDAVLAKAREAKVAGLVPLFGKRRTYFDIGYLGGARVLLVQCEMGSAVPGGSLSTVSDAIDEFQPLAVVMVGIAFGVDKRKQTITGILVSRQLQCYEPQKVAIGPGGEDVVLSRGDRVTASTKLLGRFRAATAGWTGSAVKFGLMLSGEKLVDNPELRQQLVGREPEAIGGEMEGAGLYVAAHERNVDWIVVKAICDWADGQKRIQKRERQEAAARSAVEFVVRAISVGGFGASGN